MTIDNLKLLDRQVERAGVIVQSATDKVVRIAGTTLSNTVNTFKLADRLVLDLMTAERQERGERDSAIAPLAKEYEKAISVILMNLPHAELPDRALARGTPDDLVNASRKVQQFLLKVAGVDENHPLDGQGESAPTGEPWAIDLAREFALALALGASQYDQAIATGRALQKAIEARAIARVTLDNRLVLFRRLVRDTYGPESREYHSLRDRTHSTAPTNGNGSQEQKQQQVTPSPAPLAA